MAALKPQHVPRHIIAQAKADYTVRSSGQFTRLLAEGGIDKMNEHLKLCQRANAERRAAEALEIERQTGIGTEPNKTVQGAYGEIASNGSLHEILNAARISGWFREHYPNAVKMAEKRAKKVDTQLQAV